MPSGAAGRRREVGAAGPDPQRRRAAMEAARQRYGGLSAAGKRKLLDELELLTGYHRKSLLRLLNQRHSAEQQTGIDGADAPSAPRPHHRRRYGPEAAAALVPLWEASDRLCGKRLKALLPLLVESLEHHEPGWLEIDLVAHCGGRMQGPFLWTLVAIDIATGWSESVPILVRDGAVVLTA